MAKIKNKYSDRNYLHLKYGMELKVIHSFHMFYCNSTCRLLLNFYKHRVYMLHFLTENNYRFLEKSKCTFHLCSQLFNVKSRESIFNVMSILLNL
jgi:hypothetical protein